MTQAEAVDVWTRIAEARAVHNEVSDGKKLAEINKSWASLEKLLDEAALMNAAHFAVPANVMGVAD